MLKTCRRRPKKRSQTSSVQVRGHPIQFRGQPAGVRGQPAEVRGQPASPEFQIAGYIFSSPVPIHYITPHLIDSETSKSPTQCIHYPNYCWERERRRSIWNKLKSSAVPTFTELEEEEIDRRADNYVRSVTPDPKFYILPEDLALYTVDDLSNVIVHRDVKPQQYGRRRRRRSYSHMNCFVTHHCRTDHYDNTRSLPKGCRLIKPVYKLVELVARAIAGSPDGLLQVQQIYSVLQNRYPYFRYMDKAAITSWRSSIRHALYQKWFQKTRFSNETINNRGCYWRINGFVTPKEWNLPKSPATSDTIEDSNQISLEINEDRPNDKPICVSDSDKAALKDITEIANECGIYVPPPSPPPPQVDGLHHIPSPVREADPILVTCATDWDNIMSQHSYYTPSDRDSENKASMLQDSNPLLSPLNQLDNLDNLFDSDFLHQMWATPDLTDLPPPDLHQFSPLTPLTKDISNCLDDPIFISSQSSF